MKRTLLVLAALALALAVYWLAPPDGDEPLPQQAPSSTSPTPAVPADSGLPQPQGQQVPPPGPTATPTGTPATHEEWSSTRPAVNLEHIFEGQVNKRGKAVGFHSRPGGKNPADARVTRVIDKPNRAGVYTADVEVRNRSGRWLRKRSTFYPDRLSREEILAAVLKAWNERDETQGNLFRGPSGKGFTIEGRTLDNGDINTAYPIFSEAQ